MTVPTLDYLVDDEGATGDGSTLDTAAIQAAIVRASDAGGGRVVLTPGKTYLAGSIVLLSHVELHVPGGATLKASPEFADFSVRQNGVVQMDEPASDHSSVLTASFLSADDARGVALTGRGVIDGNGRSYVVEPGVDIHAAADHRVFTIYFRDIVGVAITDVRIVDGSLWTVRLSRCDDVVVHAVSIKNDVRMPNSDGIDIDACRGVRISDCDIQAGDDAICLKAAIESTRDGRVCENVTIVGCTLQSSSTAILCGVECDTAIQDVVVSGCVIYSSNRGLAVSLRERGMIRRVRFENIVVNTDLFDERWWGRGEPIYVTAAARSTRVGTVSEISFRGITARSPRGIFLYSEVDGAVEGITVSDVELELIAPDRVSATDPHRADIRPVPHGGIFDDPVVAIRVHGVRGSALRDVRVTRSAQLSRTAVARITDSMNVDFHDISVDGERLVDR
ncbi:glycoside hydrolase family 28 protein [Lacisediminihabitans sp. H27-G8]|uniref:glycoside hydrolase family 28 protein n=1 Tax=Lacisediminihabitans sp. H27-G8 TaxID=3111909 RepID=UPI0038FC2EB8